MNRLKLRRFGWRRRGRRPNRYGAIDERRIEAFAKLEQVTESSAALDEANGNGTVRLSLEPYGGRSERPAQVRSAIVRSREVDLPCCIVDRIHGGTAED